MSSLVAFVGSRSLSPSAFAVSVSRVVAAVVAAGLGVAVSCCPSGPSALVRQLAPVARVSSVEAFSRVPGRARFAARAAALIRTVAGSGPRAALVAWVGGPCPSGVVPARSWRSGSPVSGSWCETALGVGLGLPVFVFWCGSGPADLPAWLGVSWVPVSSGALAGSWAASRQQLGLFELPEAQPIVSASMARRLAVQVTERS